MSTLCSAYYYNEARVHCRVAGRRGVTVGFEIDLCLRQSLYQNKQRNNKLSVLLQYYKYIIIILSQKNSSKTLKVQKLPAYTYIGLG